MKINNVLAASLIAGLTATAAQAADISVKQAIPAAAAPSVFSWSGFYAGGQIGGSWLTTDFDDEDNSIDLSGFIGGLYAGFNFDMGNQIVLGAETDFVWGDVNKNIPLFEESGYSVSVKGKQRWMGATRVRAGYAVDRLLPYISGGVAYTKLEATGELTTPSGAYLRYGASDTLTGWTIGAGVDYALNNNLVVRLEYRYNDFGDKTFGSGDEATKVDFTANDVRVGVAYKF